MFAYLTEAACRRTLMYACVPLHESIHVLVEADAFLVRLQLWQVPRSTSSDPQQWFEAAAALPPGSTRTSTPAPVKQPLALPAPPAVSAVKAEPVDAGQAGPQKPQVSSLVTATVQRYPRAGLRVSCRESTSPVGWAPSV